jgi:hypothetical protein
MPPSGAAGEAPTEREVGRTTKGPEAWGPAAAEADVNGTVRKRAIRSADRRVCGLRILCLGGVTRRIDQIRVLGSEGIRTRSMTKPQHRFCYSTLMPAYSLKLDHFQSWGRRTNRALTGFM